MGGSTRVEVVLARVLRSNVSDDHAIEPVRSCIQVSYYLKKPNDFGRIN